MQQLANGYFPFAVPGRSGQIIHMKNTRNEREKRKKEERKERWLRLLSVWCFQGHGGCKCLKYLPYLDTTGFDCTLHENPTPPTCWHAGVFPTCHLQLAMGGRDNEEIPSEHVAALRNSTVSALEYTPLRTYKHAFKTKRSVGKCTAGMNIQYACETPWIL